MSENNSKVYISRPEFLYEIKEVMKDHKITLQQAIACYCLLYEIEHEVTGADTVALYQKGLLKAGGKVVITKLFGDKLLREQATMKFNFVTKPKSTPETLALAANLREAFVPDKYQTDEEVKKTADTYFKGDTGMAEHFLTFKYLFPRNNSVGDNTKWNTHFGFSFEGTSRWDDSAAVVRKFQKIYLKKDIGIFLSGLYFYIKDSIEFEVGECYATKPNKFLDAYSSWYDLAKKKYEEASKKPNTPKRTL